MTDVAAELAELLQRHGSWQVEYQDHPPAWVATRRPTPSQVHVLAAYDLHGLEEKLTHAEAVSYRHAMNKPGRWSGTVSG